MVLTSSTIRSISIKYNHMTKKTIVFAVVAVAIVGAAISFALMRDSGKTFPRPIPQPLRVEAGDAPVTLGDLAANKVAVSIPAGTFGAKTAVTIVSPERVGKMTKKQGTIIGSPFELSAGSTPTRLGHLVTVTIAFDASELPKDTDAAWLSAAFFAGTGWRFIRPDKVDIAAGTLTFTTDHFTQFAAVEIPIEEKIKQHAHSETLAQMSQDKMDETVDAIMDKAVDGLLEKGLKLDPKTYKSKILASLLKKREYGDMVKALENKDFGEYAEKMNALVGETLVEELPKSDLIEALKKLGDEEKEGEGYMEVVGEIAKTGGQAAGALAAGDLRGAAKYIGDAIASKFVVVQAAKVAVEIMQFEIDTWRDDKIEAAYEAYRDGKESNTYLGPSVDKGDFEAVWLQTRAIGERLELEAVAKEEDIRREGNAPPLSDREIDIIKGKVKTNLKAMFESRAKQDAAIAKQDSANEELLKAYKKANLLEEGSFRYNRDKYDIDTRIDSLLSMRDMILSDLEDNPKGKKPTDGDIVALTQAMLSGTMAEGKKLYAERLKKDFGVDLEGTAVGAWILKEIISYTSGVDPHPIYQNPAFVKGGMGGEIPNSLTGTETIYGKTREIHHEWSVPTMIEPDVPFTVSVSTTWKADKAEEFTNCHTTAWWQPNPYQVTPLSEVKRVDPGLREGKYWESHVGPASGSYTDTWKAAPKDGEECLGCIVISVAYQNFVAGFYYNYVFKK